MALQMWGTGDSVQDWPVLKEHGSIIIQGLSSSWRRQMRNMARVEKLRFTSIFTNSGMTFACLPDHVKEEN